MGDTSLEAFERRHHAFHEALHAPMRETRRGVKERCYHGDTESMTSTMSATTTVKLPPELKARITALARQTGRSTHSLIVEAVEQHADRQERLRDFVKEALAADADIERTGEVYRAEDVHAWLERLAGGGKKPSRPKTWRR